MFKYYIYIYMTCVWCISVLDPRKQEHLSMKQTHHVWPCLKTEGNSRKFDGQSWRIHVKHHRSILATGLHRYSMPKTLLPPRHGRSRDVEEGGGTLRSNCLWQNCCIFSQLGWTIRAWFVTYSRDKWDNSSCWPQTCIPDPGGMWIQIFRYTAFVNGIDMDRSGSL